MSYFILNGLLIETDLQPLGAETLKETVIRLLAIPGRVYDEWGNCSVQNENITLAIKASYDMEEGLYTVRPSFFFDRMGVEIDIESMSEFDELVKFVISID